MATTATLQDELNITHYIKDNIDAPFVQISDNIDPSQISQVILIAYLRYIAPPLPQQNNPLDTLPIDIIILLSLYLGNYLSTRC